MKHLIPRGVQPRIDALLDTLYTVGELAGELHVTSLLIRRRWMPQGLRRAKPGYTIWLRGSDVQAWARKVKRHRERLGDSEAWCLHCRGPCEMLNPIRVNQYRVAGTCAVCGGKVDRGVG